MALIAVALLIWWPSPANGTAKPELPLFYDLAALRAVMSASAAVTEHYVINDKWIVDVERRGDVYFVTWPIPPGPPRPGPDFQARVQVDANTYEVLAIALGS